MNQRVTRVLCIANYFLPGFAGGGPIRSIANLAYSLSEGIQFDVFTRCHDLGNDEPYSDLDLDTWIQIRHGSVYYAAPRKFGLAGLKAALRGRCYDVLYINNLFGVHSSILPHLWNSFGFGPRLPVLIAPRGGLTLGALGKNPLRKRVFLFIARVLRIYRNVDWHASSALEAEDILRQFPEARSRIHVAPDLVSVAMPDQAGREAPKTSGKLRLVFLSRISPMKNLLGLISFLSGVRSEVDFDIFGPVEDEQYWVVCQKALEGLPKNVTVRYMGPVSPAEVGTVFAGYDLFALPTFGENFGHVVFEALQVGTPVLISDRTIWRDDPHGAITSASLETPQVWTGKLDDFASFDAQQQEAARRAARDYADRYKANDGSLEINAGMFHRVARGPTPC